MSKKSAIYQAACEYAGYDYEKLSWFLNINKQQVLLPKRKEHNIYYEWNGNLQELDNMARELYDKKMILSVKEFKRLFKPVTGQLAIKCFREKTNNLMILFHLLKEFGLITPRGKGNSGHFAPFVKYSVDKDGLFLIKKSANKEHEKLKRNTTKYLELREKMEIILKASVGKSMRQLMDNGNYPPNNCKQFK